MNALLSFFVNWKTTSAGLAAILVAIGSVFTSLSHGALDQTAVVTAATAVIAGLGLVFAKDANVSGTPTLTHGTSPVAVPTAA